MDSEAIYVLESIPHPPAKAIYLAGPVPRDQSELSWHSEAEEEIRRAGFGGYIIVPRFRADAIGDSKAQIEWEHQAMSRADALLFWIPRTLWTLPGLTSNLEWGIWHDSGKAVLGAPPDAPKMRYLRFYADLVGAPRADTLREAAGIAVKVALGEPSRG